MSDYTTLPFICGALTGMVITTCSFYICKRAIRTKETVVAIPKLYAPKMVIAVCKDLNLRERDLYDCITKGVILSYDAGIKEYPGRIKSWETNGQPKIVIRARSVDISQIINKAVDNDVEKIVIDRNNIPAVVVLGPDDSRKINNVSGNYPLY